MNNWIKKKLQSFVEKVENTFKRQRPSKDDQEKMLQAFGRVGRKNNQLEYTLRIRDDTLIEKLYSEDPDKLEIDNMNELFG